MQSIYLNRIPRFGFAPSLWRVTSEMENFKVRETYLKMRKLNSQGAGKAFQSAKNEFQIVEFQYVEHRGGHSNRTQQKYGNLDVQHFRRMIFRHMTRQAYDEHRGGGGHSKRTQRKYGNLYILIWIFNTSGV